mgnify:CR=1 FL=1
MAKVYVVIDLVRDNEGNPGVKVFSSKDKAHDEYVKLNRSSYDMPDDEKDNYLVCEPIEVDLED